MRRLLAACIFVCSVSTCACNGNQADAQPIAAAAPCADSAHATDAAADTTLARDTGSDAGARCLPADAWPPVDAAVPETLDLDADSYACAVTPLPIQSCCVDVCHVVVRLDYETRTVLDYIPMCEAPHAPLRTSDLATTMQATFGMDAPPEATMTGFDLAFWHAPTGEPATVDGGAVWSAGAFMFVDRSTNSMLVGGTVDTTLKGGALLFPRRPWTHRGSSWRPSCKPAHVPTAAPVYPNEGPAFGAYLAGEAVQAAWNNAIGMSYENAYHGASSGFTAAAFRYAPTYRGSFRDWIVVVRLGTPPCGP